MTETPRHTADWDYLIIGGATKSATTSLFAYLGAHPQVCASSWKEARFFLDEDYPLEAPHRLGEGLEAYEHFFSHCSASQTLRLEATPDYLFSPGTPGRIQAALPGARMVFILREPVSRLFSWYRFARQRGLLPEAVAFEEYVRIQLDAPAQPQQFMRALEQGCYAGYLAPYLEIFGRERVFITFYEHLAADPLGVMRPLCQFAGLPAGFYDSYAFTTHNRTEDIRLPGVYRLYSAVRRRIRQVTHDKAFHRYLKTARQALEPVLMTLLRREASPSQRISPEVRRRLTDYYRPEVEALSRLLGRPLPWRLGDLSSMED